MRKITIHRSLYRPILFVGCERIAFLFIITIGGLAIMAYQTIWMLFVVFIFYVSSIITVRKINEVDPHFFLCIYRYLLYYQDFYPANAFFPSKADKPRSHFE